MYNEELTEFIIISNEKYEEDDIINMFLKEHTDANEIDYIKVDMMEYEYSFNTKNNHIIFLEYEILNVTYKQEIIIIKNEDEITNINYFNYGILIGIALLVIFIYKKLKKH